ncbi:MAG: sigma-70 family RNA polymerase sigma factor [Ruminococcus sp.]|jgi:RNA polymerase sigma-70 factor (ECF subfamily)|nr:sigma-70 family RNA polymerase sigma factor [Ruminococcus sp.]
MTDVKWLELLEKSPKKAHTMLIEEYGGYVYAVVIDKLRSLCSSEEIEDCVSDVFVELFTNIHNFDSSKGSLKGYISVISKRAAINAYRKLSYRQHITMSADDEETEIPVSADNPEEDVQKKLFRQRLWEIVEGLGEPDSSIIVYQYFYDFKVSDIAEKLRMTAAAVQKRSLRARQKIKKILEKEYAKENSYE